MLISEIRDEIVEECGIDSEDAGALTKIVNVIKAAMRRLPKHTLMRTLLSTESVSLTGGTNNASLPTGFIKERYIYRKSADGKPIEIKRASISQRLQENPTAPGTPSYYWIEGKTIYFEKTVVLTATIYIDCFMSQVSATFAITDTFFGTDDEIETVKDLAKYRYYKDYEEDMEKARESKSDAAAGIAKMNSDYMIHELPGHVEEA